MAAPGGPAAKKSDEPETSTGGGSPDRIVQVDYEEPEMFGYKISGTLRKGSVSVVRVATKLETNQAFAVKIYQSSTIQEHQIQYEVKREIAAMRQLDHSNIIRFHEVQFTQTECYVFMELAVDSINLWQRLKEGGLRLKEGEARNYFSQLIRAVGHMHIQGVYHRDLNPANILLSRDGELKVAHFRSCALRDELGEDGLVHGGSGTPPFSAPEVSSIETRGYDGAKADVWSCGAILFTLVAGYEPFQGLMTSEKCSGRRKKKYLMVKGDVEFPRWFSSSLKNLLKKMLDFNTSTRITAFEVIESEWFRHGRDVYVGIQVPFFEDLEQRELEEISLKVEHSADDSLKKLQAKASSLGFNALGKRYSMKLSSKETGRDFGEAQILETGSSTCEITIQKQTGGPPSIDFVLKELKDTFGVRDEGTVDAAGRPTTRPTCTAKVRHNLSKLLNSVKKVIG